MGEGCTESPWLVEQVRIQTCFCIQGSNSKSKENISSWPLLMRAAVFETPVGWCHSTG